MENFDHRFSSSALSFSHSHFSGSHSAMVLEQPKTEDTFREILLDIADKDESFYKSDYKLKDDLGMDSLDMVELVMYCERDFHITLRDHEWQAISEVGELWKLIERKRDARSGK